MKPSLIFALAALIACAVAQNSSTKSKPQTPKQPNSAKLTQEYSRAAITALLGMDDKKFHAFQIAVQAAKTQADKLSVDRMKSFLMIHILDLEVAGTMFDDEKNREKIRVQTKCRDQWVRNLHYNDPDVPTECGLKF